MSFTSCLKRTLVSLLLPQQCALCESPVTNSNLVPLCTGCGDSLTPFPPRICIYCGIPLPGNILEVHATCGSCRSNSQLFDRCRSWGSYESNLKKAIRRFKFGGARRLAVPLADLLLECLNDSCLPSHHDWVIPVPSHPARRRKRGFEHTTLLARHLSRSIEVPIFRGMQRSKNTPPLFGLDQSARKAALEKAFSVTGSEMLADCQIILVDDVLTTGTTVREACRELRRTNPSINGVTVLVVARSLMSRL